MAIDNRELLLLPLPEPVDYFNNEYKCNQQQQQQIQKNISLDGLYLFQPMKPYQIYFINRLTSVSHIMTFIEQARQTPSFSIDTKLDDNHRQLALIKIEFVHWAKSESSVIIFEMLHLPVSTSGLFFVTRSLLKTIFHPSKRILVWNNSKKDLLTIFCRVYFSKKRIEKLHIIDLQEPFKQWYNRTFKHNENCYVPSCCNDDALCCNCPYRPYTNINDKWTLHKAINYVFNEFINESIILSQVREGDKESNGNNMPVSNDIRYYVGNCLAITKLALAVDLNWTIEQLYQYKKYHQE